MVLFKWFDYLIAATIGGLVVHLREKYKNRLINLNYKVWHQSLGTSQGDIEIKYRGKDVKSIFFSTIEIENNSNLDIANLDISIKSDPSSLMFISEGAVEGSLTSLSFTSNYTQRLTNFDGQNINDAAFLTTTREYSIPALNRRNKARIFLLIENGVKQQPFLTVGCNKAGVNMKYVTKFHPRFMGESQYYCAWLGSVVALALAIALIQYVSNLYVVAAISAILGLFALLIGVSIIKLLRLLGVIFG